MILFFLLSESFLPIFPWKYFFCFVQFFHDYISQLTYDYERGNFNDTKPQPE